MDIHEGSTSSGKSTDHRERAKVMVSITTPSGVPKQRAPVDVVLVLHVQIRLIAPRNWHDLLVKATQVVLDNLGEKDRLAIVPASLMEETAVKPKVVLDKLGEQDRLAIVPASLMEETAVKPKVVLDKLGKQDRLAIVPASLIEETAVVLDKLGEQDRLAIVPASLMEETAVKPKVVLDKLGEQDRLAIVPASLMEKFYEKPKFYEMSSVTKKRAFAAVEGSQAMRRNGQLLTDLESAESDLYNRKSEEKEEHAAHIIVISNSNEDLSSAVSWRFRSVHAFGFRDAHNGRKMGTIASNSESTYAVFDEGGDEISPAFAKSMEKITSGVEPLEVRLKCGQDVVLSAICAPRISYFISNDKKFGIIWASARRTAGTVTNFVVELQFPKHRWSSKPNRGSSTHVSVEAKYGRHPNSKSLKGACKELNKSVSVDFLELLRMEAVKMVYDELTVPSVRDKYDCEQLHKAADRLDQKWTEAAKSHSDTLLSGLDGEMRQMVTRLYNNYLWLEYMLSWKSQQRWPLPPIATAMDRRQRQATTDDPLLRMRVLAQVNAIPEPIRKPRRGLLPVLVEVTVPVEGLAKAKRASLDLVVVLDVSCKASATREMKKKRLELLHQAMNFILKKLSYKDRLAIIHVDQSGDCAKLQKPSEVKVDFDFRRAHHHRVSKTNLSNYLTDAVKLLDGRGEDNERLGLIILISDGDDISILRQKPQRCNYTVHTFGLHGERNSRTMHAIATDSSGIYAIINDHQDKITETFMACIRKVTCTIAVNTKVNIICSNTAGVKLSAIESGQFESSISDDKKFGSIFAGDLYAGAVKRFVAYLEKGQGYSDSRHLSSLLQVNVTWQPPHQVAQLMQAQVKIIKGPTDPSSTDDVKDKVDVNVDEITDVVDEIARLKEMEIVSAIIGRHGQTNVGKDLAEKVQKLRKDLRLHATSIRVRPKGSSYEFRVDEESLASLEDDLDNPQLSYILSWLSYQGLCEKPPSAPSRRRQDIRESSQQDQENMSPEEQ
ncbi:unnamed protein product [Miscanthus lutarioriparius]|uniref:VWFA domain-containing protein n=1 Tax=Miscanthus lutarioriparius TaxID=422564 RepID=A0A811R0J4_9POAL|nr:unnamed protein product [Miscanthus lutarioriparius]